MTRHRLILTIVALSFVAAACGGYEENKAAYDEGNTAYGEAGNATYGEGGNTTYDASGNNAAYTPPPDGNASVDNLATDAPPPTTNSY